jgi:hypothetical protein
LKRTNELRITGIRHLLDAAIAVVVRRIVVESMVFIYGYGDFGPVWLTEQDSVARSVPKHCRYPRGSWFLRREAQRDRRMNSSSISLCLEEE